MRKLFLCALAGAIGFVGMKFYERSQKSDVDALILQNIEALTNAGEATKRYINHHCAYYHPVTNLKTDKCYAFCYETPYQGDLVCHKHSVKQCCRVPK